MRGGYLSLTQSTFKCPSPNPNPVYVLRPRSARLPATRLLTHGSRQNDKHTASPKTFPHLTQSCLSWDATFFVFMIAFGSATASANKGFVMLDWGLGYSLLGDSGVFVSGFLRKVLYVPVGDAISAGCSVAWKWFMLSND